MEKSPQQELESALEQRLYDPGTFVSRNEGPRKGTLEKLDSWKLRALMTFFDKVQIREVNGESVIIAVSKPLTKKDGE